MLWSCAPNLCVLHRPVREIQVALYLILYTLYLILYTLYLIILYTLYFIPYTLYLIPYTLYLIPYTLYVILYTLYLIRHSSRKGSVQAMVWLPVFGTSNGHTHVDACDCTRGLYGHRQRVCTEGWLWETNSLPHRGLDQPASAKLRLGLQSDAVPAELSRPTQVLFLLLLIIIIILYIYHALINTLIHFPPVCAAAKADCNFTTAEGLCAYRQGCRDSVMTNWTVENGNMSGLTLLLYTTQRI